MVTKYGIISDIHKNPEQIHNAVEELQGEGVDAIILNGDIGDHIESQDPSVDERFDVKATQKNTANILRAVAKTGLTTYVQPGSHETILGFLPVIEYFEEKYPNIKNLLRKQFVKQQDHDLLFLPGSFETTTGEFGLNHQISTGLYLVISDGNNQVIEKVEGIKDLVDKANNTYFGRRIGEISFQNINDAYNLVKRPERTVAICHVPARSNAKDEGIDHAVFEASADGRVRPAFIAKKELEKTHGRLSDNDFFLIAAKQGLTIKRENVGNERLRDLYESLGITKQVSGHIHESGHNAHTTNNQAVRQMEYVDNLQWNSGCLDNKQLGVLLVDGEKVAYKNLRI